MKASKLLADLQKKFGQDKVMMASDIRLGSPVSTGSLALDFATGFSGLPSNRVVEICGNQGVGKTTLSLLTMTNALKANPGRLALILDLEHKMTPAWLEMIVGAEVLGSDVVYLQPTSVEEATNMYRAAVDTGTVCFALLDSIGGAPTIRRNTDATVGHYGGNSQGVGEFARTATVLSAVHDCLTIGVNQIREDMSGYNRLITPGGKAWGHAVVLRIELVKGKDVVTAKIEGEDIPVGYTVYAKVRKNQVGAPGRVAMYWFHNVWTEERGFGVDTLDEITRLGIKTAVIDTRGGWYYHPALPDGKAHGLEKLKEVVRTDESARKTLVSEILAGLQEHAHEIAPLTDPDLPVDA